MFERIAQSVVFPVGVPPRTRVFNKGVKKKFDMAKVKVFLSFEFDRDEELHRNFYAQTDRGDSCHDIEDCSLNEAYKPHDESWLKKANAQISRLNIVIVIIGDDTHTAPGVAKEVTIANQIGRRIFQIRPQGRTGGSVPGAGDVIPWKWKKIDAQIGECLNE